MARMMFGGGPEDVYLVEDAEGDLRGGGGFPARFYTAETGGSQLTDLQTISQQSVTTITTSDASDGRARGQVPPFFGPDNTFEMWCSVNNSPRFLMQASNLGSFAGPLLNQLIAHLVGINPHQTSLRSLTDVDAASAGAAVAGQALVMGPSGLWVAGSAVTGGGGGGGDATLSGVQTFSGAKTFSALTTFTGGTTQKPATISAVGRIMQALANQNSNLDEWRDSSGSARSWVSPSGNHYFPNGGRVIVLTRVGDLTVGAGSMRYYNDTGTALAIRSVRASVGTASTSGTPQFDVNVNAASIFGTQANRPTIPVSAFTSGKVTGFNAGASLPDGAFLTADVDIAGTGTKDAVLQIELW